MKMRKTLIQTLLLLFMTTVMSSIHSFAQCPKNPNQKWAVDEVEKTDFWLDERTPFKIALAHDLTSETIKTGDLVQFTVLEPVYGTVCEMFAGKTGDNHYKRVVVIPKDARIFGRVDYAQPPYPFWVRGKAKLFIFVNSITLESGVKIPLQFALPEDDDFIKNLTPGQKRKLIRNCKLATKSGKPKESKTDEMLQCITGRRKKLSLNTAIIAGLAGTIAGFITDDDTGALVGGFTLLQSLAGTTNDLVNGPNATLSAGKSIYEVRTTARIEGYVLKSKEEKEAAIKDKKDRERKEALEKCKKDGTCPCEL